MRTNSGRAERESSANQEGRGYLELLGVRSQGECRLLVCHVEAIIAISEEHYCHLSFWEGCSSLYGTTLCLEECLVSPISGPVY